MIRVRPTDHKLLRLVQTVPRLSPRRAPPRRMSDLVVQGEHEIQKDTTELLNIVLDPSVCWTAIDHASASSEGAAGERKGRGVKPGVADYLFWLPPMAGAYAIEMKTLVGRMSKDQKTWRKSFVEAGGTYALCRSREEVVAQLQAWNFPIRRIR